MRPDLRNAGPSDVPSHNTPAESSRRQLTVPGGKSFASPHNFANGRSEKALRPLGVANQVVPSAPP